MGSVLSILRYEYKMQITRIPTWGVLLTSLFFLCWTISRPVAIYTVWSF